MTQKKGQDHEQVLASIRRLVAREVDEAEARDAASFPKSEPARRFSLSASVQPVGEPEGQSRATETNASSGPDIVSEPLSNDAATFPSRAPLENEEALRDLIREVLGEEVRTRIGPRINKIVRRMVQEELAAALSKKDRT